MPTQTRTFRDKILRAAAADGSLGDLWWFVEFDTPTRLVTTPAHRQPGHLRPVAHAVAADYPARWIPCLPVAPDPIISQHYAEILLELFRTSNRGRGLTFALSLTTRDLLDDGFRWYEWGKDLPIAADPICPHCGAIGQDQPCPCHAYRPTTAQLTVLASTGKAHYSYGWSPRPICGHPLRPQWISPLTTWEQRHYPTEQICRHCAHKVTKGKSRWE